MRTPVTRIIGIRERLDPSVLPKGHSMTESNEEYKRVLRTLLQFKSMPFLEITALCGIDDDRLREILAEMERKNLVRVAKRQDIFDQVVTLRETALLS